MTLEEDLITAAGMILATEEVVEAHLIQTGRGCVTGDMPANTNTGTLGSMHHNGGIPTDVGQDSAFDGLVAGVLGFLFWGNGVDVVSPAQRGDANVAFGGMSQHAQHHDARPMFTYLVDECIE